MTNAMPIQEWLDVIRKEYLEGFVRDGGTTIKFAVPTSEDLAPLLENSFTRNCFQPGILGRSGGRRGDPGPHAPRYFLPNRSAN